MKANAANAITHSIVNQPASVEAEKSGYEFGLKFEKFTMLPGCTSSVPSPLKPRETVANGNKNNPSNATTLRPAKNQKVFARGCTARTDPRADTRGATGAGAALVVTPAF